MLLLNDPKVKLIMLENLAQMTLRIDHFQISITQAEARKERVADLGLDSSPFVQRTDFFMVLGIISCLANRL